MKLLILTQTVDYRDPILGFFHRWILEFAKKFDAVYVICLYEGMHELPANVFVYSLGKEHGVSRLTYCVRLYKYVSKLFFVQKIDRVFFHMGAIYNILLFPFFLIRKITHTKFLWWKTHGKLNWVGHIAAVGTDEIVTAGSFSFVGNNKKVRVVGHAIDTDAFRAESSEVSRTPPKILSVGRVTPIKKNEISIRVLAQYMSELGDAVSFDIFGPITDTEYKQSLDALIQKSGVADHVTFQGSKSPEEMRGIYPSYSVLLHPSYEAGFDKVVLEAMAAGVIPLTSIRSFKPILNLFGLYIPPQDVDGYVFMLRTILEMNDSDRVRLIHELRNIVIKDHSIATLPERIFGVL